MEPRKGFYSLVQFCPDHSRMEAVNVGVVLCVPEVRFIRARMARANMRAARLFGRGTFDPDWLNAAKASLEQRLEVAGDAFVVPEDLNRFVATRANKLVLTVPRPVKVVQPDEELERLFAELVDRRETPARREPLIPELEDAFHRPTLANRIMFNHKVTVPVVNRSLDVPYAYRNGEMHLVKPVLFCADPVDRGIELVTEGDLIQKRSETATKLIVVPDLSSQPSRRVQDVRKVLTDLFSFYEVRLVWEDQRQTFVNEVEHEAHPV